MKTINGGVCASKGFKATGLNAGIKNNVKKDMALVYSDVPCVKAGTFTTNKVQAAPVKWDKKVVYEAKSAQAMVINSGIANACTGVEGYEKCEQMAAATAKALGIDTDAVMVASTGVIGRQLPMDVILSGIEKLAPQLGDTEADATLAAEAIMTTDTVSKQVAVEIELGGVPVHIGGMCKGSGMIHPNMATMLCFVTSDVAIEEALLQKALKAIIEDTFNMISVDGDTSTNDSVLLLANGLAGNKKLEDENSEDYKKFYEALYYIMEELSKKIAGDGEGATALLEVTVIGAATKEQAATISKSVVCSSLVKSAIYGHDANWGRISCAMGYSGADLDPDKFDIWYESVAGKIKVAENGIDTGFDEEIATKILSEDKVTIICDIKMGDCKATAWGCDLTYDYVKINADYRS